MNHKVNVEKIYGETTTQLASSSEDKKRLQMVILLGAFHSPHVTFRVMKEGNIIFTTGFLDTAVEEYNKV